MSARVITRLPETEPELCPRSRRAAARGASTAPALPLRAAPLLQCQCRSKPAFVAASCSLVLVSRAADLPAGTGRKTACCAAVASRVNPFGLILHQGERASKPAGFNVRPSFLIGLLPVARVPRLAAWPLRSASSLLLFPARPAAFQPAGRLARRARCCPRARARDCGRVPAPSASSPSPRGAATQQQQHRPARARRRRRRAD